MIHELAVIGEPPEHRSHRLAGNRAGVDIDPSALIEALVTVDAGIHRATTVGARSWLMKKVHVGHDALIGNDCEIAPLTSVGGHVELGDRVRVGQGAVFRPFVKIGDGARIGAGAVVVTDVPAGEVWAGNPARLLRRAATGDVLTPCEQQGWDELAAFANGADWEMDEWQAWYARSRAG